MGLALDASAQSIPVQGMQSPRQVEPVIPTPSVTPEMVAPRLEPVAERPPVGAVSELDRQFAMAMAEGNLAEIQLGQMASTKASNPMVKQMGQKLVTDHSQANQELVQIAGPLGIPLPASLTPRHQSMALGLAGQSGAAFDQMFVLSQIPDHAMTSLLLQTEINQGTNPALKAYAAKYLPAVEQHRAMLSDISQRVCRMQQPAMPAQ
jgi:putative membrane protein